MIYSTKDKNRLIVNCHCGCKDGVAIKVEKDEDDYANINIIGSYWYMEQKSIRRSFLKKIQKIWYIIRDKDYYYASIILNKAEWDEFVEMINRIDNNAAKEGE